MKVMINKRAKIIVVIVGLFGCLCVYIPASYGQKLESISNDHNNSSSLITRHPPVRRDTRVCHGRQDKRAHTPPIALRLYRASHDKQSNNKKVAYPLRSTSHQDSVEEVLTSYSAPRIKEAKGQEKYSIDLARTIPPDVEVVVVADSEKEHRLAQEAFRDNKNVTILSIESDLPISIWTKNPLWYTEDAEGNPVVLASKDREKLYGAPAKRGDDALAEAVAEYLHATLIELPIRTYGPADIMIETINGKRYALVGESTVA